MVTHEDWVAELHRLDAGHKTAEEDGWYTVTEITGIWATHSSKTRRLLGEMVKAGRAEKGTSYRARSDGRFYSVAVYRLKESENVHL